MSAESVRELERAATAGTLDPVRVLVELDRRGLLSRGLELHARARRPLPRIAAVLAAYRAGRMSKRLPQRLTDALWNREDVRWEPIPGGHAWIDPTAMRAGELDEPRRTRGVSSFVGVFNMLEQIDDAIEQTAHIGMVQWLLARTQGYSLPAVEPLEPPTFTMQIGRARPATEEKRAERLKKAREKTLEKAREKTLENVRRKPPRTL